MFYEFSHSLSADYFTVEHGCDFNFPAHMHHCFELLCILEGEMHVEIDDVGYDMVQGDAAMIFSNQIHSMKTVGNSKHVLTVFSPRLISAYSEKTSGKIPLNNIFRPDMFYIGKLETFSKQTPIIDVKGLLYSICGEFDAVTEYHVNDAKSNMLLYNIFKFIENNYNKNCMLSNLAKYTGYDYAYISRYFRKTVGISYNDYVNQYRISKACYLLQNNEMSILEISNECGFNSLRSLNRHFKEQLGIPPADYRKVIKDRVKTTKSEIN